MARQFTGGKAALNDTLCRRHSSNISMKLEFLPEGCPDCPLLRLYSFTRPEVLRLKEIADQLSTGKLEEIALHEELDVEPVTGCQLYLRLGTRDDGIVQNAPQSCQCIISEKGWARRLISPGTILRN